VLDDPAEKLCAIMLQHVMPRVISQKE